MRSKHREDGNGFDLIILGGGSAAFAAAIRAAELGAKVAIAEEGVIGGTCLNRGCFPTKNLLHAAELYHLYGHNQFPGIPSGSDAISFGDVIKQKDDLVEEMRGKKYWDVLDAYPDIKYYPHKVRFVSPDQVEVGEEVLKGDKFIIATGVSPKIPPIPGLQEADYLTYKEALELEFLPDSMVIIGGGPIGVELGQMYARFGTKVTILEALPRIISTEEEEISHALKSYLEEEGMEIWTKASVESVKQNGEGVLVSANVDGNQKEFRAQKLLIAAGMSPNTGELNLEATGVEVDDKGAVKVDDHMRTTARHIWAIGDVTGGLILVTVAANQGTIAAENAIGRAKIKVDYSAAPHAIFTTPQVASVGLKEAEAVEKGLKIQTTVIPLEYVPKAAAIRDTRGLVKLVVGDPSYQILGVHMLSAQAADLIHIGVLAVKHKLNVGDIINTTFVYPTMAEALKIAALSFRKDVTKLSCCAE